MKKPFALLLCALPTCVGTARSADEAIRRSHYTDATYGFSLDAPRFPGSPAQVIPVTFFAPRGPVGKSNLSVVIQHTRTTRRAYLDRLVNSARRRGMKVLASRDLTVSGLEAVEIDVGGIFPGHPEEIRQLQLAVIQGDRVILVSCTTDAESFREIGPKLRASLSSLRLGAEADRPVADAGRSCYVDATHGLRIEAPRFPTATPTQSCSPVIFKGTPASRSTCNVRVTVDPPMTRERVREESEADSKKPGFKIRRERDLKLSGREAVESEVESPGDDGAVVRTLVLTVLGKDRTYAVSCTAPGESFAAYEAEYRACLESFALSAPNP
jgi:hypothetical protein